MTKNRLFSLLLTALIGGFVLSVSFDAFAENDPTTDNKKTTTNDTKREQIEEFIPKNKDVVTMYTCGPTVYHFAHIGNLRSYIMEDILEKTLTYLGYNVKRAMNITDVGHLTDDGDYGDDKMLKGAKREHKTVLEIASFYTEKFKEDCKDLNIKWPEIVVPATSCIDVYINFIQNLLDKGFAYISNGNVYFDVSKLKEYYVLTNHNSEKMLVGAREGVEEDEGKKNQADFALWFTKSKFDAQELKWNSPWGLGYPGWHIECSGISYKYLGEYLDIHCGGVDNKFPHHTNEIAQSESFLGHKWCNYWFHVEHLNNETGKMSKSEGGFVTVGDLKNKGYNPLVYRYFCLTSHYSKPLIFSFERLDGANSSYNKLKEKIKNLRNIGEISNEDFNVFNNNFKQAIGDNLNTSMAITVLHDVLKANISGATKFSLIKAFDDVLGLDLLKFEEIIPNEVISLAKQRWEAKQNKNFGVADELRNKILALGFTIKDSKDGYEIVKNI